MKLKSYLRIYGIPVAKMAEMLGMSRQTVYNIIHKRFSPQLETIKKIEEATGKKVTFKDFI